MNLVLSLFPGIGLLDQAFEESGFCVVRGPDLLWGGDVHSFHPPRGRFDGVIGGPPCQAHSRMRHIIKANGHRLAADLIPEFARVIDEASPKWWVMEMVPDGPTIAAADGDALVHDVDVGGLTSRIRRISWAGINLRLPLITKRSAPHPAVVRDPREQPVQIGGSGRLKARRGGGGQAPHEGRRLSVAEMLRRQGFDEHMLDDCPLTLDGKRSAIGNGVPLAMGRAIAKAVKAALG